MRFYLNGLSDIFGGLVAVRFIGHIAIAMLDRRWHSDFESLDRCWAIQVVILHELFQNRYIITQQTSRRLELCNELSAIGCISGKRNRKTVRWGCKSVLQHLQREGGSCAAYSVSGTTPRMKAISKCSSTTMIEYKSAWLSIWARSRLLVVSLISSSKLIFGGAMVGVDSG